MLLAAAKARVELELHHQVVRAGGAALERIGVEGAGSVDLEDAHVLNRTGAGVAAGEDALAGQSPLQGVLLPFVTGEPAGRALAASPSGG